MSFDIYLSKISYDFNSAIRRHMSAVSKIKNTVGKTPKITESRIDPSVRKPFHIPAPKMMPQSGVKMINQQSG